MHFIDNSNVVSRTNLPSGEKEVDTSNINFSMSLVIPEEINKKIMHWVKKVSHKEFSALGKISLDKETNTFKVEDVVLVKQKNSGTSTEMDPAAIGKAMFLLKDKPGDLRWWLHSHHSMGVFWSGTDTATIKQLALGGWFVSTVVDNENKFKTAFSQSSPVKLIVDDIPTKIEQVVDTDLIAAWDKEYDENVVKESAIITSGSSPFVGWQEDDLRELIREFRTGQGTACSPHDLPGQPGYFKPIKHKSFWSEEEDIDVAAKVLGNEPADAPCQEDDRDVPVDYAQEEIERLLAVEEKFKKGFLTKSEFEILCEAISDEYEEIELDKAKETNYTETVNEDGDLNLKHKGEE